MNTLKTLQGNLSCFYGLGDDVPQSSIDLVNQQLMQLWQTDGAAGFQSLADIIGAQLFPLHNEYVTLPDGPDKNALGAQIGRLGLVESFLTSGDIAYMLDQLTYDEKTSLLDAYNLHRKDLLFQNLYAAISQSLSGAGPSQYLAAFNALVGIGVNMDEIEAEAAAYSSSIADPSTNGVFDYTTGVFKMPGAAVTVNNVPTSTGAIDPTTATPATSTSNASAVVPLVALAAAAYFMFK